MRNVSSPVLDFNPRVPHYCKIFSRWQMCTTQIFQDNQKKFCRALSKVGIETETETEK